jgi:hypothetical protein
LTLAVTYDAGKQVTLSGQLTNSSGPVASETINFTGVVSGTATTNSQGLYRVTLPVSSLGNVTANSADGLSNPAQYTLVGGTPVVNNFMATSEGGGVWLFTGTVTGAPVQGEVVDFGGINALKNQHVTVNADGTFSFYATVASGQGGYASAEAVDWWGDTSNEVYTDVTC